MLSPMGRRGLNATCATKCLCALSPHCQVKDTSLNGWQRVALIWEGDTMLRDFRSIRLLVVLLLVVAVLAPVAVSAAGGTFTDDDSSIFEGDIEWMAANGITAGCNPPTNDHYCPNDAVTRGQMAAFMKRLATKNVVDAADSVLLDGKNASYYESAMWANDVTFGISGTFDGTNQVWEEMTIAAPNAGYLLINASASVYDATAPAQTLWWLQVDDSACKNTGGNTDSVAYGYASITTDNYRQGVALTGGATVDAGDHTITLCGRGPTGTQAYGPNLTALFTTTGAIIAP